MKKIVYILVAVAAFCFASCEKDNDAIVFKATAEAPNHGGKTNVNMTTGQISWSQNDAVKIKSGNGTNWYTFVKTGSANTFSCLAADAVGFNREAASYQAVYPASLEDGGTISLPSKQNYVANSVSEFPMYTETTNDHLNFKNTCGLLKLTVKGDKKVKEIILSSSRPMCGTVTVGSAANDYVFSVSGETEVSLDCGSGVQLTTSGENFYIYLPQDYYTGFAVQVVTNDGYTYTRHASTGLVIARNTVTTLPFSLEGSECEEPAILDNDAIGAMCDGFVEMLDFWGMSDITITGVQFDYNTSAYATSGMYNDGPLNDDIYYTFDLSTGVFHVCTPKSGIKVTGDMAGIFTGMSDMTYVNFGDNFYTQEVEDMRWLFQNCSSLTSVYLGKGFSMSGLSYGLEYMFATGGSQIEISCTSATKAYLVANLRSNDKPSSGITWHELD